MSHVKSEVFVDFILGLVNFSFSFFLKIFAVFSHSLVRFWQQNYLVRLRKRDLVSPNPQTVMEDMKSHENI